MLILLKNGFDLLLCGIFEKYPHEKQKNWDS